MESRTLKNLFFINEEELKIILRIDTDEEFEYLKKSNKLPTPVSLFKNKTLYRLTDIELFVSTLQYVTI